MFKNNIIKKLMVALLFFAPQATMAMNPARASKLDPAKQEAMRKGVMSQWARYGDNYFVSAHLAASPERKVAIEEVIVNLINEERYSEDRNKRVDKLLAMAKSAQNPELEQFLLGQGAQRDRGGAKLAARVASLQRQKKQNQRYADRQQQINEEFKQRRRREKEERLRAEEEQRAAQERELLRQKEWVGKEFHSVLSDLIPAGCPPWAIM